MLRLNDLLGLLSTRKITGEKGNRSDGTLHWYIGTHEVTLIAVGANGLAAIAF